MKKTSVKEVFSGSSNAVDVPLSDSQGGSPLKRLMRTLRQLMVLQAQTAAMQLQANRQIRKLLDELDDL